MSAHKPIPEMVPVVTINVFPWLKECYPALKSFEAHYTAGGCYIERYDVDGYRCGASGQSVEAFRAGLDELTVPRGIEDAFEAGMSAGLMVALKTLGPRIREMESELAALRGMKGVA